jgi:hypothetical protein
MTASEMPVDKALTLLRHTFCRNDGDRLAPKRRSSRRLSITALKRIGFGMGFAGVDRYPVDGHEQ